MYSPRIYTYKITFEEVPYYYYGVHKERTCWEEYWGSPVTNKWCWELYTPKKQILEIFDSSDEGWIKAQEIEGRLIKPVFNTDKWCLNANCLGVFSLEQKRKAGKIGGEIGGKIVGKKAYELATGIFAMTNEEKIKMRMKGIETQIKNNIGIFGMDKEQKRKIVKKSHETQKNNNSGFFGMSKEEKSLAGKKGGLKGGKNAQETLKNKKLGIYGLTKEQRYANGKKVGSQKWVCLETGFITNAGNLTKYQNKRGIDTSKRMKLE
jgi:hypothetical protein